MIYKSLILLTNFSSLTTLYIGYKHNEYMIANFIFMTSLFSFIFHLFDEYNYFVSYDVLNYFRIIDFFYSYKSIYITLICLFFDYNNFHYNYNIIIDPLFLWLAINEREKNKFLTTILPTLIVSIMPVFYLQKQNIIYPLIKSYYLLVILSLIISNIFVYISETKFTNYHLFHSIHHLLCFSIPGFVILYKTNNKKFYNHYYIDIDIKLNYINIIERKRNSSDVSNTEINI
jgi:hypothetical protein